MALHTNADDNMRFESREHGKSVLAGLQHLRQMRQLFDVTLVAESKEFHAHRVVLASCSDYFRAMFTDGLKECSQSVINLNGLTASSISHLIDFAYNSSINIDSDNVVDVLSGATHVQILPVITACENYLKDHLSMDSCVSTAGVAELFCLSHLTHHVHNFICRNWSTFSMSEDFHHLSAPFLVSVLSSGYPVNCKEVELLESLLSWFSYMPLERNSHMSNLLKCIMFENIDREEFESVMNSKEWFELTVNCPKLLDFLPIITKLFYKEGDFSSGDDGRDTIVKVTNYNSNYNSPVSVTRIQVRHSPPKMAKKRRVPGLINNRGFHSTILVAGGFRKESGMTNNVLYLDSSSGTLRHLTKIPHLDQINFGMSVLYNQLYIVGGCFNDHMQEISHPFGFRYSPDMDEWTSIAPMAQERCRFLLCSTDDRIYAVGGDPYTSDVGPEDAAPCEVYNPTTNRWRPIRSLPGNRSQLAGTSLGKSLFISGGIQENEEKVFQDLHQYDPRSDTWCRRSDLLSPRTDHCMFTWEGRVYVVGGWHLDPVTHRRVMATTIDSYDPDTDSWRVEGTLNRLRTYGTYTVDKGCIYAIGGWTDGDHSQKCRTIDTFDLRFKAWVEGQDQSVALWEHGSCSLYLPKFVPQR
ncbi:kelch-like protein 13 [Plakobranchus ocellatus]|uniref:Kelch-like protein 13 n=1 Tax=Plakobranchus ocellatus TaxID=259542 RepID=A0AAV3YSG7_9GAST|nr:kelch-like protein 13 [Plakobranchus ocellatus]